MKDFKKKKMNKKEYKKEVLVEGSLVDFDACVELMDHYILEDLNYSHFDVSDQKFMDAYCALHEEKFNQTFNINRAREERDRKREELNRAREVRDRAREARKEIDKERDRKENPENPKVWCANENFGEHLVDFDICVHRMDDDIREEVYESDLGYAAKKFSAQAFLDAYCKLHEEKFNELFIIN